MNFDFDNLFVNEILRENIFKGLRKNCIIGFWGCWLLMEFEILYVVKFFKLKFLNVVYMFYLKLCYERNVVDRIFYFFKYKIKDIF